MLKKFRRYCGFQPIDNCKCIQLKLTTHADYTNQGIFLAVNDGHGLSCRKRKIFQWTRYAWESLDSRDADTHDQIDHQYDLGLETMDFDL